MPTGGDKKGTPADTSPPCAGFSIESGAPTVWIGWSKDYRTASFIDAVGNPAEYSSD